ncbi:6-phosphogluconolactonase [Thalassorhabdomicrobium marinisediminis]|uniref:6-phosphogluconolactonase n=1 Tax=Thalassorhabdomicrobium marinisediminis TaxID=2170577 RepID=A0A2T7FV16_9RHOB|nr:6-phosphogluconolactonase [Thalassorhabdomicrobium marinisediminis]PVA06011.1 6-phosphogluconolactonase [Thalassorhabdomicrobium marinisediminis]
MDFIEYPDVEMLMINLANKLAGEIRTGLLSHERVTFAVPGGSTPGPMFDVLCGARQLDWSRVDVMLTDERLVPEDHERSNTRLLRERLLVDAAAEARYVPIVPQDEGLEARAAQVAEHLPITVLLLGMGADMHTASLFPNSADLDHALNTDAALAHVQPRDGLEPRVTLSAKALQGAVSQHILITGAEKRDALERAQHLKPHEAPVATVLSEATVHWADT